jgi:RimJ/RimL family protein N-acetyltransferase
VSPLISPAEQGELVTLADGRRLLVRPLYPSDRQTYADAVAGMSARSRYLRFAAPKPRFSERELDFLTQPDGDRHVAFVAIEPETRRGIGVGRYVRSDERTADVAIGVTDEWQRRGVGRLLLDRVVAAARAKGLTALTATALAENAGSRHMLGGAGFELVSRDGITNDYRVELGGDM